MKRRSLLVEETSCGEAYDPAKMAGEVHVLQGFENVDRYENFNNKEGENGRDT